MYCTRLDISEYVFAVIYKWLAGAKVFWDVTKFELTSKKTFNKNICLNTFDPNV